MNECIKQMKKYAEANNVPIMESDSIEFIRKYIKLNNVKKILEIGSAIGYSAVMMASVDDDIEVLTVEKDETRYKEAVKNINACNLNQRIEIVFDDALDINLAGRKFDLILIDAAKGQYIKYFDKFKYYINDDGIIFTDNMKFHGLVGYKDTIESKNVRGIVDKIEKYREYLKENEEFITKFYDEIGDGISVSFKKNNDEIKGIN